MPARSRLFRVNLGAELRTLERTKMSTRTVASHLGTSPAWVSRTETGARYPTLGRWPKGCANRNPLR